jgi:hypothetical protein
LFLTATNHSTPVLTPALSGIDLADLGMVGHRLPPPAPPAGGAAPGGSTSPAPHPKSFFNLSEDEIEELVGAPW